MQTLTIACYLNRSLFSPLFQCIASLPKKGKGGCFCMFYGRFRRAKTVMMKQTMMTTMIAAMPGSKYWSAIDGPCVACGAGVVSAASTANAVVDVDGQYALLPWNVATTVYLPWISGVHWKL
jgi:hypothetical protein